jgi:hypothetical protein
MNPDSFCTDRFHNFRQMLTIDNSIKPGEAKATLTRLTELPHMFEERGGVIMPSDRMAFCGVLSSCGLLHFSAVPTHEIANAARNKAAYLSENDVRGISPNCLPVVSRPLFVPAEVLIEWFWRPTC